MNATIQRVPRSAVRLGVAATRLPLTAVEALAGRRDDDGWPPSLAFEGAEARLKQVIGDLLHDDTLAEEGRLLAAKVTKIRQAEELDAVAEDRRDEADERLEIRREQAERQRRSARTTAQQRKARAAEERDAATREAEAEAERKRRRAEGAVEAAQETIERQARRDRSEALAADQAALEVEKQALAKTRTATADERRIAASKRARDARG